MKKITLLFTLISNVIFSQIQFEKGYIIDNNDTKIACFIKNYDWLNNPTSIIYKLSENDAEQTGNPENVKEFGIENEFKYITSHLKIDKSSQRLRDINGESNPVYNVESVFLKVLIAGEANLFTYVTKNATLFFFNVDTSEINQLIYKEYKDDNRILKNETYKKQLFSNLKCNTISIPFLNEMMYSKNDLIKIFIDYNVCKNSTMQNFSERKNKKAIFNFTIRPRISYASISMINTLIKSSSIYFDNTTSFAIGGEIEYILPFNKNKWALIFEPTYQKTTSTGVRDNKTTFNLSYSSIEIPLGIRQYFFLKNNSKFFINASTYFDANFNSGIYNATTGDKFLEVKSRFFGGFGAGYQFKDKYSVEIRYFSNKDILSDYLLYASKFNSVSLIIGFQIF